MMKNICLTIAGSDPTSGAGIQADIRTFDRCGVHPFSVITAITYQTATQFHGYKSLSDTLDYQLDAILKDYPVKYVKIGMIPDIKALDIIVDYINRDDLFVVYDPITISSVGDRLSSEGLELEIERNLFPHVRVLTPNISEAEFYSGKNLKNNKSINIESLKEAAKILLKKLCIDNKREKAVVIKSALSNNKEIYDFLCYKAKGDSNINLEFQMFKKNKISFKGNIHGTGCVFSSAITAFLVKQNSIPKAIEMAEAFFDEKFSKFITLPNSGYILDLTVSEEKLIVINQIKEVYNYISSIGKFATLIPEVRLNISCSLPNAKNVSEIAGIDGRVTIVENFPKACGEIKFGASDHTARLVLSAKSFDNSINMVTNLKYNNNLIKNIKEQTKLTTYEFSREMEPNQMKKKEQSTMQWLIKRSAENFGKVPDIIWDKGGTGKEPIIRVFAKDSKDMIEKLKTILEML